MNKKIEKRVLNEAYYILNTNDTLRGTAKRFNISKSTVHKDLKSRLSKLDKSLLDLLSKVFEEHNEKKHIRGGQATKEKYKRG